MFFDNSLKLNSITRNFEFKVSDFYLILYSFLFLFVCLLVVIFSVFRLRVFVYLFYSILWGFLSVVFERLKSVKNT